MNQKVVMILEQRQFQKVEVNISKVQVYYQVSDAKIYVVVLLDLSEGNEFTKEQYAHMVVQIKESLKKRAMGEVLCLTLVFTNHSEVAKQLCSEENIWIADTKNGELLLYENSSSDFCSLRKVVESICEERRNEKERNQEIVEERMSQSKSGLNANDRMQGEKNRRQKLTVGTVNVCLVGCNILIFLIMDLFGLSDEMLEKGALYWPMIVYEHQYYRLITCMFLHGGIDHLVNNMLVLFVIGDKVEKILGKVRYLILYFGAGIIAGICSMRYNMEKMLISRSIGASGAIFGVVGAIAYIVIVNRGRLQDISRRQIILFVLLSLYGGFTSQGVDNIAHVGGLIAGCILAAILYKRKAKMR